MICAGFLSPVDRADLTALARDGSAAPRDILRELQIAPYGENRVASGLISALAAPDHNGIMRPASSPASASLIQPAARISAAWRSSSCAIMGAPFASPINPGDLAFLRKLERFGSA